MLVQGRLPLLVELVLNTPSHHRMHHRPPGNCNYAGVLIVWDRLFGTFESELSLRPVAAVAVHPNPSPDAPSISSISAPEGEGEGEGRPRALIFGLARPLPVLNPLLANVSHLLRLLEAASLSRPKTSGHQQEEKKKSPWSPALVAQFLSLCMRRRVRHPLTVALTWQQLFPDMQQQWRLYAGWRAFAGQLFFLPPSLAEAVAVSPQQGQQSEEEQPQFSRKEREFFAGRLSRESRFSSPAAAGVGFLLTLAASFALLLLHERLFSQGSAAERAGFLSASALCVAALQHISSSV